jgi:CHASE2 domain-containing sensor protein
MKASICTSGGRYPRHRRRLRVRLILAGAWGLTLGAAIADDEWLPAVPTLGYMTALKVVALAYVVALALTPIKLGDG